MVSGRSGVGTWVPRLRSIAGLLRRAAVLSPRDVLQRVSLRLYRRTNAGSLDFPLLDGDVADSTSVGWTRPTAGIARDRAGRIGWVMTPPGPGSGGHTTALRMVEALEARGHECTLFLYDRFGGGLDTRADIVRRHWPQVRATVRDARAGIDGVDAVVATSWDSAHVLARSTQENRRLYFLQDFEPFFYGRGPEYELASDSYRFGFRCIALGPMVAALVERETGVRCDVVPFGGDSQAYRLDLSQHERGGIAFFARPDTPRRGYVLGKLAVEEFHRRRPSEEIHVFGTTSHDISAPVTLHGRLSPVELSALYNRTVAGLSLSFTNVSLVPAEMLASGLVPVVNESPFARECLVSPEVVWSRATPVALADALIEVVDAPDREVRAQRAAASAVPTTWAETAAAFCALVEEELHAGVVTA